MPKRRKKAFTRKKAGTGNNKESKRWKVAKSNNPTGVRKVEEPPPLDSNANPSDRARNILPLSLNLESPVVGTYAGPIDSTEPTPEAIVTGNNESVHNDIALDDSNVELSSLESNRSPQSSQPLDPESPVAQVPAVQMDSTSSTEEEITTHNNQIIYFDEVVAVQIGPHPFRGNDKNGKVRNAAAEITAQSRALKIVEAAFFQSALKKSKLQL